MQVLLATHVDDTIWANEPEVDFIMDEIRKELVFGTEEQFKFRFCGIEVDQDPKSFAIRVSCEQTSKKLSPIRLSSERSKQLEEPATEDEREQLMSVTGSLMWISRSCRPGISYSVSKLQSATRKPNVADLVLANKVVKYVLEDPTVGITYKPGLEWPKGRGDPLRICVAAMSDASHGNEEGYLSDWDVREAFRSQGAKLVFIASTNDARD